MEIGVAMRRIVPTVVYVHTTAMRRELLDFLCCPACRASELALQVFAQAGDHVMDGLLTCRCGREFCVVGGVPRMLGPELYQPPEGWRAARANQVAAAKDDELSDLKRHTIRNFGYQWNEWGKCGWTDENRPTEHERGLFWTKSLLSPAELAGQVVLDAGCGNGRYSYFAADHARAVISVDLSHSVDAAFRNLGDRANVHIVQGDLFNLPVREGVLDVIFSIGVLMHTGDARAATASLAERLRPGGSITVHVYHKGTPMYEVVDAALRRVTTRLPIPTLRRVSAMMSRLGVVLERRKLLGYANIFLRLHLGMSENFDWYAAPIATHHTYPEVFEWFRALRLEVVADNRGRWHPEKRRGNALRRGLSRFVWRDWALTVRGRKPAIAAEAAA